MGYLNNVDQEHSFHLEGKIIYNLKEFLEELKIMDDDLFRKHVGRHNDFYNWISHVVQDNKLAARIKNLTLKNNFIKVIEERVEFLEKLEMGVESDKIDISLNTHEQEIVFSIDKENCCLCDICMKVCPQEAIKISGDPLSIKVNDKKLDNNVDVEILNPKNEKKDNENAKNDREKSYMCVLCGFCVPFCPVFALDITIDGQGRNPMEDTEALPVFHEPVSINGVKINKIFEGEIKIDSKKCPDDCEDCVSACPTFAIKREGDELKVNEDYCFYCGACVLACCEDAINLKRTRAIYENGFCSNWNDALDKLIGPHYINIDHDNRSMNKIQKLIKNTKEFARYDIQADIEKEVPELMEEKKEEKK